MVIAQGHEGLNDHDLLHDDPVFAPAVGREDITGSDRPHEPGPGHPPTGTCTPDARDFTRKFIDLAGLDARKRVSSEDG